MTLGGVGTRPLRRSWGRASVSTAALRLAGCPTAGSPPGSRRREGAWGCASGSVAAPGREPGHHGSSLCAAVYFGIRYTLEEEGTPVRGLQTGRAAGFPAEGELEGLAPPRGRGAGVEGRLGTGRQAGGPRKFTARLSAKLIWIAAF